MTDAAANRHEAAPRLPRWIATIAATVVAVLVTYAPTRAADAFVHVTTPNLSLVPSVQDYANDYIDATGSAGIQIKVKTSNPAGLILKVRSSGPGNTILLGDLLLRTLTPAGAGGTALTSWTPLALTDVNLWSTGVAQGPFAIVGADLRVRNLGNYDDNLGAGFTSYSHTLIFTVVAP